MTPMFYILAAFAEITGCFAFWSVFRLGKSSIWLGPGILALILFAWALSRIDVAFAGRAFSAYGGIYITASLCWMWLVEGARPDRWDVIGVGVCLLGAGIILFGPRGGAT